MDLPILDSSYRRNRTICDIFCLPPLACFQGSSMFVAWVSIYSFLLPTNIPLYGYTTFYLSIHQLRLGAPFYPSVLHVLSSPDAHTWDPDPKYGTSNLFSWSCACIHLVLEREQAVTRTFQPTGLLGLFIRNSNKKCGDFAVEKTECFSV